MDNHSTKSDHSTFAAIVGVQVFLYWIVAIGGISLSIVGTNYMEKWGLRKKIANRGMAQAMFDTLRDFMIQSVNYILNEMQILCR